MSTGAEKLMLIHDASRNDGLNAIISAFEGLPVKSGDELTLLGIIHSQPTSPLKIKSIIDNTGSIKDDEQLTKEYLKREEVIQLSEICANKKITFDVKVQSGCSPKEVAAKTAKSLMVNWVVLERQMKRDKKYFNDKLTCGILRIKRNNTIEKLRGPIEKEEKKSKSQQQKRSKSSENVSYGEMIPVMSKQELSSKKASNTQKVSSSSSSAYMASTSSVSFKQDENVKTSNYIPESKYNINVEPFVEQVEEFEYSVCSVCQNKRPSIRLKQDFSYKDLQQATNGFSSDNFLSEGGFGSVYEGKLKCGLKVAVKQHKDASLQGEKEFKAEVNVLSKARHPNLVMLLGSCSEGTHRLLVYEFVCFGSLDEHLSSHELTWDKRIKIALGSARGLDYLHKINIIHRDMRPNNILVTHDYEPMLGDFGLARVGCIDTDETGVVGTIGYVAPEYAECGKVSAKTDVYSFGVVLLQLITGCKTKENKFEGKTLVEWARPLLEDKNYPDLIDDKILDSPDVHVFQLYHMVKLVKGCLKKDPTKRYRMEYVVQQLECIKEGTTTNRDLRKC